MGKTKSLLEMTKVIKRAQKLLTHLRCIHFDEVKLLGHLHVIENIRQFCTHLPLFSIPAPSKQN